MKILHSFANEHNVIWKELLYSQFLSALLAKEHYGSIEFFTTKEIAKAVEDLGLPYSSIDTSKVSSKDATWSLPKLRAYQDLKEPFVHIDNDSFIFNKINFDKFTKPIMFSHPDMNIRKMKPDLSTGISSIIKTMNVDLNEVNNHYSRLNETYLRLYFQILNNGSQDSRITDSFDLGTIPNMNITVVKDVYLFTEAVDLAIDHYEKNRTIIDNAKYGPCYVEQLGIHQILRNIDGQYQEYSDEYKHVIFEDVPTLLIGSENYTPNIDDVVWPLVFETINICSCCNQNVKDELRFFSLDNFRAYINSDFGGFLHATYMKWYDWMQALIIDHIRTKVGEQPLLDIHNYYREIYPSFDLPIKSGGEKLYERLTNFSFD